jgi:hypothetical protein
MIKYLLNPLILLSFYQFLAYQQSHGEVTGTGGIGIGMYVCMYLPNMYHNNRHTYTPYTAYTH